MTTASVIMSLQMRHSNSSGIGSSSSEEEDGSSGKKGGFSFFPIAYASASIVGIAYFPVLVSIAPFMLGSFTSIIKLLGIPVLFLILGPDSKFLSPFVGQFLM